MKYTQQEVNKILIKERRKASLLIFFAGVLGMLAGKCSNTSPVRDVKSGIVVSDSNKTFQPGDTIKVILIKEKQR